MEKKNQEKNEEKGKEKVVTALVFAAVLLLTGAMSAQAAVPEEVVSICGQEKTAEHSVKTKCEVYSENSSGGNSSGSYVEEIPEDAGTDGSDSSRARDRREYELAEEAGTGGSGKTITERSSDRFTELNSVERSSENSSSARTSSENISSENVSSGDASSEKVSSENTSSENDSSEKISPEELSSAEGLSGRTEEVSERSESGGNNGSTQKKISGESEASEEEKKNLKKGSEPRPASAARDNETEEAAHKESNHTLAGRTTEAGEQSSTGRTAEAEEQNSTGRTAEAEEQSSTGRTAEAAEQSSTGRTAEAGEQSSTGRTTEAGEQSSTGQTAEGGEQEVQDTVSPVIKKIIIKAADCEEEKVFQADGQSVGREFETAGRDFSVTLEAEDLPVEGASGLKSAGFRLEELKEGGDELTTAAVFDTSEQEGGQGEESGGAESDSENLADRSGVSGPWKLTTGEDSLFPGRILSGNYILHAWAVDADGNRSRTETVRLEFDNTPPEITVSMCETGTVEKWPAYHKADNCSLEVRIKEKNLQSYEIRVGRAVSITEKNGQRYRSEMDEESGESVFVIPAELVLKNSDGETAVQVRAVDEASQKVCFLKETGEGMIPRTDDEGNITAAVFVLDTKAPEIQIEHRAADRTEAFLYEEKAEGKELTVYSAAPIKSTVRIVDRCGDSICPPDGDSIRVFCRWKQRGDSSYSVHALQNAEPSDTEPLEWTAEFSPGEGEEGKYFFEAEASDRAGNRAAEAVNSRPIVELLRKEGVRDCRKGTGSREVSEPAKDVKASFLIVYDRTPPLLSLAYKSSAEAFLYKFGDTEKYRKDKSKERNKDRSKHSSKDSSPDTGSPDSRQCPSVDAYIRKALTVSARIESEEHIDPDRLFFTVTKTDSGIKKDSGAKADSGKRDSGIKKDSGLKGAVSKRISFADGTREKDYRSDCDGKYICSFYGTDKAGNGAVVEERLQTEYREKESVGSLDFAGVEGCADGYIPRIAFTVDTAAPEAEILYTVRESDIYLYDEKLVREIPRLKGAAVPAVSAYGRGRIQPSVTVTDQNVLDPGNLEVTEYGGKTAADIRAFSKSFRAVSGDPAGGTDSRDSAGGTGQNKVDGSRLLAYKILALQGPEACAFYAVRGTDRAGNHLHVTERFDGPASVLPGSTQGYNKSAKISAETSSGSGTKGKAGSDGGTGNSVTGGRGEWYVSRFLLVLDQLPPAAELLYKAEDNGNSLYLYREKTVSGGPDTAAYFHGDIVPSITVTENNVLDRSRWEVLEYVSQNRGPVTGRKRPLQETDGAAVSEKRDPGGTAGSGRAVGTAGGTGKRQYRAGGLTKLTKDGTCAFYSVRGTDRAGNPVVILADSVTEAGRIRKQGRDSRLVTATPSVAKRKTDASAPVYTSHLYFVIDKSSPEISMIWETKARAFFYSEREYTGKKPSDVTSENGEKQGQREGKPDRVYAFVPGTVRAKISLRGKNENIDPDRLYWKQYYMTSQKKGRKIQQSEKSAGHWTGTDGAALPGVALPGAEQEGEYSCVVWGEDKAGNPALITETFSGPASDRTGYKNFLKNGIRRKRENCRKEYDPFLSIIVDRTAPRISIEYQVVRTPLKSGSPDPDADLKAAAWLYADRGEVLNKDGTAAGGLSAYISGRAEVSVSLEEDNWDPARLRCSRSFIKTVNGGRTGIRTGDAAADGSPSDRQPEVCGWQWKEKKLQPETAVEEGEYRFGAYGTDRAGNPAIVEEKFSSASRLHPVDVPKGCGTSLVSMRHGSAYTSYYTIVIDRTAPRWSFEINQPENLSDSFDSAKDKQIVYYGRAVSSVRAVYTVEEEHFDQDRILSGITFLPPSYVSRETAGGMTEKKNTAAGGMVSEEEEAVALPGDIAAETIPIDRLFPEWKKPDLKCTELHAGKGMSRAVFSMAVEVSRQNEGIYRFEIAGCDKAGNLLVPEGTGREGKNTAREAGHAQELTAQAAMVSEHEKGSGEYWTGRKVVDATPPTGTLKVCRPGDRENSYYEFLFATDGNCPVRYEPFRKEDSAEVLIQSEDQSPTRISCCLCSLDADRDAAAGRENPHISPGSGGWADSNALWMTVRGEQAFYLEKILIEDRAGNARVNETGKQFTMEESGKIWLDTSSPGISPVTDSAAPQIRILADGSFTRHEADGERYIYRPEGGALDLQVSISDPGGAARSSGLRQVTVKVTAGDIDITDKVVTEKIPFGQEAPQRAAGNTRSADRRDSSLVYEITGAGIRIPDGAFAQSNDIAVRIEACDNSGNRTNPSRDGGMLKLGIDTVGPRVEVNYRDEAEVRNGSFFAGRRRAEITVADRNVDSSKIGIHTNTRVPEKFQPPHADRTTDTGGEKGNQDRWVKTLVYEKDGDYTLQIDGTDALGNPIRDIQWNGPAPNQFTIDRTAPVISISLSNTEVKNGKYYNRPQTARITVTEHNFREKEVRVDLTAGARGSDPQPAKPEIPCFTAGGDNHVAEIRCREDGYYAVRVNYTDLAGNPAREAVCGEFVIDQTPPRLVFGEDSPFRLEDPKDSVRTDSGDMSADSSSAAASEEMPVRTGTAPDQIPADDLIYVRGDFRPCLQVVDTYGDDQNSCFEAEGAGNGVRISGKPVREEQNRSFALEMPEFAVRKSFDDVYYVRACAVDLAGNKSRDIRFRFSLNRFGSTFEEGDAGGKRAGFENSRTYAYIHRYYNNRTDYPLAVREISPVRISRYEILMTRDGFSRSLKETDEYIRVTEKEEDGDSRYLYIIDNSVFSAEGDYRFMIRTRDSAGNENSTAQVMEDSAGGRDSLLPAGRGGNEAEENLSARAYGEGRDAGDLAAKSEQITAGPAGIGVDSFPIAFCVDRTPPVNRITGLESGKTRFREKSLDFTVHPEDGQTGVAAVEIRFYYGIRTEAGSTKARTPDRVLYYRWLSDGEEEDENLRNLRKCSGTDGISIPVHMDQRRGWQLMEIVTSDPAGNESVDYRAEGLYPSGGEMRAAAEGRRRFYISMDPLSRIADILPGSAVVIAAGALLLGTSFLRKKGKNG